VIHNATHPVHYENCKTLRFTGLSDRETVVFGPVERPSTAEIRLAHVPLSTAILRLECLSADEIVALHAESRALSPGELVVIDEPPFLDLNDAVSRLEISPTSLTLPEGLNTRFRPG
jgi:hypothetical protein